MRAFLFNMQVEFLEIQKQWHKAFKLNFDTSERTSTYGLSLEFREAYFGCNVLLIRGVTSLYQLNNLGKEKLKDFFSKLSLDNWGEEKVGYSDLRRACSTVIAQLGTKAVKYTENYEILKELGFVTISHVVNAAHKDSQNKTTDQQKLFLWSTDNITNESV